jgi:hypothetical protein
MENGTLLPNRTSRPSYRPRVERVERCRTTIGIDVVVRRGSAEDVVILLAGGDHGGVRKDEDAREENAAAAEGAELGRSQDCPDRARIEESDLGNMVCEWERRAGRSWNGGRRTTTRPVGVFLSRDKRPLVVLS